MSGTEQLRVDQAIEEVHESLMTASDRAGSHMAWAMLREAQGRIPEAIEAYETAIKVEPETTGPRSNLAALLESVATQSRPPNAEELMQRVGELRAAELPLLARDAKLAPENASVQYRYGLALYLSGELEEAMDQIERAVELAPDVPEFRQARDLLQEKINE